MGSATLTGTEFARVTRSYSSYSLSWIGSYTYTQDPVANTTTFTLYGSMYTGSSSNVRSANSTDVEQINGVTISPPTPAAYRYSSSMEYGFSVNNGYSLFGSTTKTVTHNADGSFPSTEISIYSKNYHHNGLSASGAITAPAIDRTAPTVSASVTQTGESTVTLSVSANVNCNKWEYKVDSGSWVSFSTTNGTSASTSISLTTGASHTITARATKTYNQITGTSSAISVDKTASTVSCSVTDTSATAVTLSASSGVNCNKWEYRIGNGSWTTFSSTNGKSASVSITGLTAGSTGTIYVRVTKTSNYVTSTASASYDKTAPSISSETLTDITANSMKLTVTTNVACRKFEYLVNNGSWVAFYDNASGTTSANATISGLSPAVSYTVNVRVTKKTNYVTASTSKSATTLGYSVITAVNNINVGSTNTITFTAYDANFYHRCRFQIGNTILVTENMGKVGATGSRTYTTSYTFPSSVLPSSSSATVTATIYTYTASSYSDASYIGSTSKTFTLTVPSGNAYLPTATLVLGGYSGRAWFDNNHLLVGGYSKAVITVTNLAAGSGASNPTITTVSPASTQTSTSPAIAYQTNAPLGVGNQTINVSLKDSRNRTNTVSVQGTFVNYSAPSVSQFSAERGTYENNTWTANPNGGHIHAVVVATCSLTAQGNEITTKTVKCGSLDADVTDGNNYYWTSTSPESSYNITVSLTDSAGFTSTFASTVGAISVPFNLNTHLPAAAFGKVAEATKTLEVASDWSLKASGKLNSMAYAPYSWSTNAGAGSQGYLRIATITIKRGWINSPITFKVNRRNDYVPLEIYLFFAGTSSYDPTVETFYVNRDGGGRTNIAKELPKVFITKIDTSVWAIYVEKTEADEELTVTTEVSKGLQEACIDVSYIEEFTTILPPTYQFAVGMPINNKAKNNVMAYMPYSWEAHSSEDTQTAGFMRIATVKITGTYAMNSIVFSVQYRGSAYVSNLYLAFTSTASGTEPTVSSFTWDGYRICNAYVIKSDTETYTWHVYVAKQTANEYATVRVYTSANFMAKGNITYSPAPVVTEVPSGATVATMPVTPSIQLQASQYYNEDKYGINMRNSDIIGANGIWFSDTANARDEGVIYPRSNGNYDTLYALDGEVYLRRNQAKNATMVAGTRLLTVDDIPKDYIIAEWTEAISGMNGTWYCVAWQNGKRECYGTFTFSVPANNWTAWGSLYEATPSTRFYIYYPSSFFGAVPTLLCSVSGSAGASGYELYGSHTKTNGPQVIILRPSALGSATTYSINLHAIGHS